MSAETPESYRQLRLIDPSVGVGKIADSDWTVLAKAHDIVVHISSVVHRNPGIRLKGKTQFANRRDMFGGTDNTFNDFYEKITLYKLTIDDYKKSHNRVRPEWARTFSQRGMKPGYDVLRQDQNEDGRFHSIERESFDRFGVEFNVFRFLDGGGNCRRVVVMYPGKDDLINVRQEDCVSRGKWCVTSESQITKDEMLYRFYHP